MIGLSFYISYHCAYKNPGTLFLLLTLIGISFQITKDVYQAASEIVTHASNPSLVFIIFIAYRAWGFYLSFRLRKINKKAQCKLMESTEEYLQAASAFTLAATLEDLDVKYRDLMGSTENGKYRERIALAYKLAKEKLSEA